MKKFEVFNKQGSLGFMTVDDIDADICEGRRINTTRYDRKRGNPFLYLKRDGKSVSIHKQIARRMGLMGNVKFKDGDHFNCRRSNIKEMFPGQRVPKAIRVKQDELDTVQGSIVHCPAMARWHVSFVIEGSRWGYGYYRLRSEAQRVFELKQKEFALKA